MSAPSILVAGMIANEMRLDDTSEVSASQSGGSAIYTAIAANYFTSVGIVSAVGSDFEDWSLFKNINTSYVQVENGWSTPRVEISSDGTVDLLDFSFPELALSESIQCDVLVLSNMHPKWIPSILTYVEARIVLLDSSNGWIRAFPSLLSDAMKRVDLLILTELELQSWMKEISNQFNCHIIEKKDKRGVKIISSASCKELKAPDVNVPVDVVGSGDVLLGSVAAHLSLAREISVNTLVEAYTSSLPIIEQKLKCNSAKRFQKALALLK